MQLIKDWKETLQTIMDELSVSSSPLHSKTLNGHIQAMRAVLFRFANTHHDAKHHLDIYRQILAFSRDAVRANNRAHAISALRYLQLCWLPEFGAIVSPQDE